MYSPRQRPGSDVAPLLLIMAMARGQKVLIYGIGVLLGMMILTVMPRKEPKEPHPWHEQTAPDGYYPLTFTDDYGRELTLERQPRWFVSLAPSITEMLFAMEMGDHLLAVTEWDAYPAKAKALRDAGSSVGAIDQPDLEIIAGLGPDLVIASGHTPAAVLGRIEQLSPARAVSLHHESFADVLADIGQLGRLAGVPGRALALIRSLEARKNVILDLVDSRREHAPCRAVILLHLEEGLLPGWSPGAGTWMGDLIEMAHGENIAARLGASWGQLSLEAVLAADPEVIFVKDGATPAAQERLRARVESLAQHPVWSQVSAVRNNRIVMVENGPFSIPGPRMVEALATVAQGLWPDLAIPDAPNPFPED